MTAIPRKGKHQSIAKHLSHQEKRDKHGAYLSFSFKYLQHRHEKFNIERKDAKYFLKLLERLANVSHLSVQEFCSCNNKTLRCHKIDWTKTTEKCFGIADEAQIVDIPWQFSISANAHGRVMGFIINNVF